MIMCRCGKQLYLLLWKNFTLHRRKFFVTLAEIFVPVVFALLFVYIRQKIDGTLHERPTYWRSFSINRLPRHLSFYPLNVSFTPDIPITQKIMDKVIKSKMGLMDAVGFESEESMINFLTKSDLNKAAKDMLGGVVFSSFNVSEPHTIPANITYKIRLPYASRSGVRSNSFSAFGGEHSWMTGYTYPVVTQGGPRHAGDPEGGSPGYFNEGFLALQYQLDRAILGEVMPKEINGVPVEDVEAKMQRMPYPPFLHDPFINVIQQYMPIVIMLAFVYSALNVASNVIHEKEYKLKESMKLMGLQSWLHWTAWFISFFVLMTFSAVIVLACFFIKLGDHGRVLTYSDSSVFFVFLLLFISASIFFSFSVSVFFDSARAGAAATFLLFFLTYVPYLYIQPRYHSMSTSSKMAACLFPNIAMSFGCQLIGMLEGGETGVQWNNVAQPISVDDGFTMLHVFVMFLVDCVIYMTIAWYKEAILPGEYGTPQPWYFPVTRSYWFGPLPKAALDPFVGPPAETAASPNSSNERTPLLRKERRSSTAVSAGTYSANFEPDPYGLPCSIQLQNITKRFGRGVKSKIAVNNLSLNIYEGQITALLGHNGAGKTTTMSMITGFIPATRGTITINGMDIRRDLTAVRRLLGLCPQHDILFDSLTVEEHLRFFAKLKDCPPDLVEAEVNRMLTSTKMEWKRYAFASTLSGGMRRRLSVAIALIGGSRIVVLDEPSSGMDAAARRELWTFIQTERVNRTILLTTHYMDEADVLGDRIAIMADGVVQCSGSSLFLKSRYGAGYHLTMVKSPQCDVQAVMGLVTEMVPDARAESHSSGELSVILPMESVKNFERLFNEIEERRTELGIESYGASLTTMEEVFLKVSENNSIEPPDDLPPMYGSSRASSVSSINLGAPSTCSLNDVETISEARSLYEEEHNQSLTLLSQQFWAIVVKRFLLSCRSYIISLAQLFVPVLFACVGLIILKTWPGPTDSPPLALTLEKFGSQVITYGNRPNSTLDKFGSKLENAYHSQYFTRPSTRFLYLNHEANYDKNGYLNTLVNVAARDIFIFNKENVIGAFFSQENFRRPSSIRAVVLFNNQPYHASAIALSALSNAVLKTAGQDFNITVINHPQPLTTGGRANEMFVDYSTGFTVAFNVVFGMAFLAASFSVIIIRERLSKVKHLHYVSGTNKFIYWIGTFAWDYINYLVPCVFIIVVFLCFNESAYSGNGSRVFGVFLFLALFGWSAVPLMYLFSYWSKTPSSGLVWLTVFNVMTGIGPLILVTIFDQVPRLKSTAASLQWAFLTLFPNYNLGQGLFDLYSNDFYLRTCTDKSIVQICQFGVINMTCCPNHCAPNCAVWNTNFMGWAPQGIGRMLVFLTVQGVIFTFICLFGETSLYVRVVNFFNPERLLAVQLMHEQQQHEHENERLESFVGEDTDVAKERRRVLRTPQERLLAQHSLVLHQMTRFFKDHCAVDRLSCVVSRGDCFGLLGANGAGKTTTFRMLTGDLGITSGDAFINGFSVRQSLRQVQRMLGYCPQFDAVLEQLTGRETLTLFARLRGLREDLIVAEIDTLATMLLLKPFMNQLVGGYSGGNKRKLSTAVALVGGPPVVCLDEPTTGMDPSARRHVWRALAHYRDRGRTLVLTSHSMEECEALCTKIAIMVNGQFKCFGSCQQLKAKFGRGYTLMAQVGDGEDDAESEALIRRFMEFVQNKWPTSELKDMHQGLLHYHLHPHYAMSWSSVFATMEEHRQSLCLENYSVSQTSLEQVFLSFTRVQQESLPSQDGNSCFRRVRNRCLRCCRPHEEALEQNVSIQA